MRVISQDGKRDIPYDRFCFSIMEDNCICVSIEPHVRPRIVAKYSNRQKSIKAMEMMHDAYRGVSKNVAMITECRIFQFPKDDEV